MSIDERRGARFGLSRRRSRVRGPSLPSKPCKAACCVASAGRGIPALETVARSDNASRANFSVNHAVLRDPSGARPWKRQLETKRNQSQLRLVLGGHCERRNLRLLRSVVPSRRRYRPHAREGGGLRQHRVRGELHDLPPRRTERRERVGDSKRVVCRPNSCVRRRDPRALLS